VVASPLPVPSPGPTGSPSLTVYHVRDAARVAGRITPDELITYKGVQIHVETERAAIAAASAAIDAALAEPRVANEPLDARWGLRFATATERFVHSVYCDAAGGAGQVDDRPVTFRNGGALIAYLTAHFGPA
jgi:hypothetical protein